ncbi:MAG TPA: cupin domain-containing protein [Planctomycetota bacterium]|nr:cupin domain-containing protein [Planctomycetota bacterium]
MKVKHYSDVAAQQVEEGAKGVRIRWVINEGDGAGNFAMRHFEIAPGGHTPHHAHAWEHEVFVLTGHGSVAGPEGETPLRPGTVVFVPPDEEHHFANDGSEPLTLLCLIPMAKTCTG